MPVFWILVVIGIFVLISISSWIFVPLGKMIVHWMTDFSNVLDYENESEEEKNE